MTQSERPVEPPEYRDIAAGPAACCAAHCPIDAPLLAQAATPAESAPPCTDSPVSIPLALVAAGIGWLLAALSLALGFGFLGALAVLIVAGPVSFALLIAYSFLRNRNPRG